MIESLLYFLNVATEGKEKKLIEVLSRLESTEFLERDKQLYDDLQRFRKLRNKVHLHELRNDLGTDYVAFGNGEFHQMRKTLFKLVKTRKLGLPKEKLKSFRFLDRPLKQE